MADLRSIRLFLLSYHKKGRNLLNILPYHMGEGEMFRFVYNSFVILFIICLLALLSKLETGQNMNSFKAELQNSYKKREFSD